MSVHARRGSRRVLGLLEEDTERLAQPCDRGSLLAERPERRRDEVGRALLVLGGERRDLKLVVGGELPA